MLQSLNRQPIAARAEMTEPMLDHRAAVPRVVSPPVKVLCVTPYGTQGRGGIDRLYYYLRQFQETEVLSGVAISYFAARGSMPGNLWVVAFPWRALWFAIRLMSSRPDIVHLNFSVGGSIYRKYFLLRIARLFGVKTVLHFHGQFTAEEVASRTLRMRCLCDMSRHATRIIVLGQYYRRAFVDIVGIAPEKLEVLANGIPDFARKVPLPKPSSPDVHLLFIGELGRRKGTDILVEALQRLARRTRSWNCIIAGNGDIDLYKARIQSMGCHDLVRVVGWLDADEVHKLLMDSDIVILPSRADTLPLALIEGACAGNALIATAVGEVLEVLHEGRNGVLVDAAAANLADAIQRLIERRDELGRMQIASRRIYSERFEIRSFAQGLCGIYDRLMATCPLRAAPGP
jgi:glycosyltransferase involved in cell wall biosynthesis